MIRNKQISLNVLVSNYFNNERFLRYHRLPDKYSYKKRYELAAFIALNGNRRVQHYYITDAHKSDFVRVCNMATNVYSNLYR